MTQHELIKSWIREHGFIVPAKMAGTVYYGTMFGSETPKRARELRAKGVLRSVPDGKFERFYLNENSIVNTKSNDIYSPEYHKIMDKQRQTKLL